MPQPPSNLTFTELVVPTRKTKVFDVCSSTGSIRLGGIGWYATWRRYVFYSADDRLFDAACLCEITEFIIRLMTARSVANARPAETA